MMKFNVPAKLMKAINSEITSVKATEDMVVSYEKSGRYHEVEVDYGDDEVLRFVFVNNGNENYRLFVLD